MNNIGIAQNFNQIHKTFDHAQTFISVGKSQNLKRNPLYLKRKVRVRSQGAEANPTRIIFAKVDIVFNQSKVRNEFGHIFGSLLIEYFS